MSGQEFCSPRHQLANVGIGEVTRASRSTTRLTLPSGGLQARRKLALRVETAAPRGAGTPVEQRGPSLRDTLAQEYDILDTVGCGTFGRVERATRKSNGHEVALKTTRCFELGMKSMAAKEYELLKRFSHPKILQAYDFILSKDEQQAVLVMDYFNGETMDKVVSASPDGTLLEETLRPLAADLFEILSHIHSIRVLHRDIKPQNILISRDMTQLRLVDFNVAICVEDGVAMTPAGSQLFAAPEVIWGEAHSEASDVWGAGLCMYYALTGHLPQRRDTCEDLRDVAGQAVSCSSKRWERLSGACKEFVQSCLHLDENSRPTPELLLRSKWLQEGLSTSA